MKEQSARAARVMDDPERAPVCEQCGEPLPSSLQEEGCLNCLLSTAIENGPRPKEISPNEQAAFQFQHYEILARPDGTHWELGRDAVGVIYKARDKNLDIPVTLKLIDRRFAGRSGERDRFLRAARAAARLRHPNVAKLLHFGAVDRPGSAADQTASEEFYYAMEFIEGESLEERVREKGPLDVRLALELVQQVARALAAGARQGLEERSIDPAHILLATDEDSGSSEDGPNRVAPEWVKLKDFGLMGIAQEGGARPAGDSESLGKILYFALTGRFADAAAFSVKELQAQKIPKSVVALLKSMLGIVPDGRVISAADVGLALQHCRERLAPNDRRAACLRWGVAGLAAAAAIIGLCLYWWQPAASLPEKSIAVLPFRNLSPDPANAYFAEGVQDDILSRLVKIQDLKVISRLGTSRYPADAKRDLTEIGRALGVQNLLQGELRRVGDRVRLQVSLVEAASEREIWSDSYDRELADAISLQGALAREIADALDATLSQKEKINVTSPATNDPDAYVLYLQGRKLENNPAFMVSAFEGAEALYRQAVASDPHFALAHARLAITLSFLYRYRGPSEDLRAQAHAEARMALRLQPDLGEAHLATGLCAYRIERDYDRALTQLKIAERLLPNDVETVTTIAYIYRRQGKWKEALAAQERALAREPLSAQYEHELGATTTLMRAWAASAKHFERAISLNPKLPELRAEADLIHFWQTGDLTSLRTFYAGLASYGDPGGLVAFGRWDCAMLGRDFAAARAAIDGFPYETLPSVLSAPVPKAYLTGCTFLAQGEREKAMLQFETARPALEAEVSVHPNDSLRHARLGLLYAYMGRKAEAIRAGERAVELTPVIKDAIDGRSRLGNLALIYARVGDNDQALALIERLLREPGGVSPVSENSMTLWELRSRWQWDPLRQDSRFQKILAAPEPATVY